MKLVAAVFTLLLVAGCAVKDKPEKPTEWKEAPFAKVKAWERLAGYAEKADVWIECETSDKIQATYLSSLSRQTHTPQAVYITRKDGTKWSLPLEVHEPAGDTVRIHTYHLCVKGREVNFFDP